MSLTIDATVGGSVANSYQAIAAIDLYAQSMSATEADAWDLLDETDNKNPAAVRATRLLDTIPFPGTLASITQALQWPRYGVEIALATGDSGYYGQYYPTTEIPACVLRAHAQLTVFLATQSSDPFGTGDAGALSELSVGPIDLVFRQGAMTTGRDYLEREIYPLLRTGGCVGSARMVRLTR